LIYDRIMETLVAQNATTSSITVLEQEVSKLKQQCQEGKQRADRATNNIQELHESYSATLMRERLNVHLEKDYSKGRALIIARRHDIQMRELNRDCQAQKSRADEAVEKVKALEEELEQNKIKAEGMQKQMEQSKEQMKNIWAEVEKGKRKAEDEEIGGQAKKGNV
jgi:peptidoglycan hydrolase CwlO-like protein